MQRTVKAATLARSVLSPRGLLVVLALAAFPAMIALAARAGATDPPQTLISENAIEELALRLNQVPTMRNSTTGALANTEAGGDDLTTEIRYLMDTYQLDAKGAAVQFEAQTAASVLSGWLAEELSDETHFGGAWIDHDSGGRLVVVVTDTDFGRQIAAAVSGLISIETKEVSATERDLVAIFGTVVQTLDLADHTNHQGSGVPYYSVSVELQKGRVLIGQSSLAPDEFRRKSESLARNPLIFVEDLGPVVFDRGGDACPSSGCRRELGGISAYADGQRCSTGFTATRVIGGLGFSGYLLGSGHCAADNGDIVRHGGSSGPKMGTQFWEQDSGSVDASVINNIGGTMTQDKGNIWRPSDSSWPIYGTHTRDGIVLGTILCRTGYRGEACGQLISKTISRNGNTNVGRLEHTSACPGDSGGPVFNPNNHYAVGLHQSSSNSTDCTSSEDSYFTFISELQAVMPTIYVDVGS